MFCASMVILLIFVMFHHYICEKWNYKFRRHEIYDKRFNGIIGTVRLTHTASVRVVSLRVERVSVQRPPRHPPPLPPLYRSLIAIRLILRFN